MEPNTLMGRAAAKVDEKGRIKVPTSFRRVIEERYGSDCFITSVEGEKAVIYPLTVWQEMLDRLSKMPSSSQAKNKYLERVNYFGQVGTLDVQGRLLVPSILRSTAAIADDVVVLGSGDHLVVWSEERMQRRLEQSPMTAEDYKELELHGV